MFDLFLSCPPIIPQLYRNKNYYLKMFFLFISLTLSFSVHATEEDLVALLKKVTKDVPVNSVVTWSRAPFEIALQRKIRGREIGEAMVLLGYKPIDQYLPIPTIWSAAHNLECVLEFAKNTPASVPIYSLTEVYKRRSGVLNLHGAELKTWEALGRKIEWGPEVNDESRRLDHIREQFLEPSQVPMVRSRLGHVEAIQNLLPTSNISHTSLPEPTTYWRLVSDIAGDASQWYTGEDIRLAKDELNRILTHRTAYLEGLDLLKDLWPPNEFSQRPQPADLEKVELPKNLLAYPHGIVDLDTYLARRIGPNLLQMLKEKQISVKVFASTEIVFPNSSSYFEVPNIYSRRGIRKFYSSDTNTLVIQIPPLAEFAKHFGAMLKLAGGIDVSVQISPKNQEQYRQNTDRDLTEAWKNLDISKPHVVLNGNPWLKARFSSKESIWEIKESRAVLSTEFGINLEVLRLRHKKSGIRTTVVSVNSIKNRWGDGAAFLAESILRLGAKSITSTGFVGGPGVGKPNDVSIPNQFFLKDERLKISNFISSSHTSVTQRGEAKTTFHFNTTHSHSFSPVEQTQKYVTDYINKGYETVDVEQTLVAEKIANHNLRTGQNVGFGSIGLITDIPRSLQSGAVTNLESLDQVDHQKRLKSINDASTLFENALYVLETKRREANPATSNLSCSKLFSVN